MVFEEFRWPADLLKLETYIQQVCLYQFDQAILNYLK